MAIFLESLRATRWTRLSLDYNCLRTSLVSVGDSDHQYQGLRVEHYLCNTTDNFAGQWMYMYSMTEHCYEGSVQVHCFKHIVTWEYVNLPADQPDNPSTPSEK